MLRNDVKEIENCAQNGSIGADVDAQLTPPGKMALEYIAPSEAMQPYIMTFFHFRCDEPEIRDVQPAAVGSVFIFLRGSGHMFFEGRTDRSHSVSMLSPLTHAVEYEVDGPFHTLGASLSPLGWAALTGLKANEARDRLFNAGDLLGEDVVSVGENIRSAYLGGTETLEALCARFEQALAAQLKPVDPKHIGFIQSVSAWMSTSFDPPIAQLAQSSGYSMRQTQRLVERYFGCTPKVLIRKYRALRIVTLLNDPATSDEQIAELLNFFYDQSHMIREVRKFAGRTPARIGDAQTPILEQILDVRNFREIKSDITPAHGA